MSGGIEPPRPKRVGAQETKSQVALELVLNGYAIIGALVLMRLLLLALNVDDRLWIGSITYRFSDPIALPLTLLPGSDRSVLGDATLADVTLLAGLILLPLAAVATSRSSLRR